MKNLPKKQTLKEKIKNLFGRSNQSSRSSSSNDSTTDLILMNSIMNPGNPFSGIDHGISSPSVDTSSDCSPSDSNSDFGGSDFGGDSGGDCGGGGDF